MGLCKHWDPEPLPPMELSKVKYISHLLVHSLITGDISASTILQCPQDTGTYADLKV